MDILLTNRHPSPILQEVAPNPPNPLFVNLIFYKRTTDGLSGFICLLFNYFKKIFRVPTPKSCLFFLSVFTILLFGKVDIYFEIILVIVTMLNHVFLYLLGYCWGYVLISGGSWICYVSK